MNFDLDPDQLALRDHALDVSRRAFHPSATDDGLSGDLPIRHLPVLADAGLLSLTAPSSIGGMERSIMEAVLAVEVVTSQCPTTGMLVHIANLGATSFVRLLGTPAHHTACLKPIIEGRSLISVSMSEPDGGSDLASMRTTLHLSTPYALAGSKVFCSYAEYASSFVVFARYGSNSREFCAILLKRDTPGFEIQSEHRFMSGERWSELHFDDVMIEADQVLWHGPLAELMSIYCLPRLGAAAQMIGTAQYALDRAVQYVKERMVRNQSLADYQGVRWTLAEMFLELDAARLSLYRAASGTTERGLPRVLETAMAKSLAVTAACNVTDNAMQLHGGAGMSQEVGLEWLYRRVRVFKVGGGAIEVMRDSIGRAALRGASNAGSLSV